MYSDSDNDASHNYTQISDLDDDSMQPTRNEVCIFVKVSTGILIDAYMLSQNTKSRVDYKHRCSELEETVSRLQRDIKRYRKEHAELQVELDESQ